MKALKLKNKIIEYLKDDSDYACMIHGEWGSGKTKLFRDMQSEESKQTTISSLKLKALYISLAGVNSLNRLKELMFEHIENSDQKETTISKEILRLQGSISCDDKPKPEIPQNVFYCFDDLERINPDFMLEAMGFINLYIEHNKNKVIFLCDETQISIKLKNTYLKIKEKYIRYTYYLEPDFNEVLSKVLDREEKDYLLSKIEKAELKNFRTVFAILDFVKEIFTAFNSFDYSEHKTDHINRVRKLILFYTFFITSEKNKGIDISFLREINFPSKYLSELHLLDIDFGYNTESNTIENKEETEKEKEIEKLKHEVLSRHFDMESMFPDNEKVERFDSIADCILMGHLSADKLKEEIDRLLQRIKSLEGTREENIINILNNLYGIGDEKFSQTIEGIIESVKDEEFSLETYFFIFQTLLNLESQNIENISVDDKLIETFKKSITRSIDRGSIKYIPDFDQWLYENNHHHLSIPKMCELTQYIETQLKQIPTSKNINIEKLKKAISGSNKSLLDDILIENSNYYFKKEDASELFNFLLNQQSNNIELFSKSLNSRYPIQDGITPVSYEKEFIIEMVKLIKDYELSMSGSKPLKFLPLMDLKGRLERYIKYYKLEQR